MGGCSFYIINSNLYSEEILFIILGLSQLLKQLKTTKFSHQNNPKEYLIILVT